VKTTAVERAAWKAKAELGGDGVKRVSSEIFHRLIADVDDATALLGEAGLAISTGAGTYDLAERIAAFLKEPSG